MLYCLLRPDLSTDPNLERRWEEAVLEHVDGLTYEDGVNGVWKSPEGDIVRERMQRVLIECSSSQLFAVMRLTKQVLKQYSVIVWKVSDNVWVN